MSRHSPPPSTRWSAIRLAPIGWERLAGWSLCRGSHPSRSRTGTRGSTATPLAIASRRLLRGIQVVFVLGVLGFAAREIVRQWSMLRPLAGTLRPAWGLVILSALIV